MSLAVPAAELAQAYEALRAQATAAAPTETARGLALLLARGLPAWISAYASSLPRASPPATSPSPTVAPLGAPLARSGLVHVLLEMALASQRSCAA